MNVFDKVGQYGFYGLLEGIDRQGNGNTFFVDSSCGSNSAGGVWGQTWEYPYATVNYAVSKCTSGANDVILVAAGHAETIQDTSPLNASGTVTDEFCVDKAGVSIIGMGRGTSRPTFTLGDATDATLEVRAADVALKNLIVVSNQVDTAVGINISNSNDGVLIENCEIRDGGTAILEMVIGINVSENADDTTIRGCQFVTYPAGSGTLCAIYTASTAKRLKIYDNVFMGDWNTAVMDLDDDTITDLFVADNIIDNLDASNGMAIDTAAGSTGVITRNIIHSGKSNVIPIVGAACVIVGNTITHAEGDEISASRNPLLGIRVQRAAADIFDGSTTALFTISGGRILITHLSMQNSVAAADDTANEVKLVMNPTTGTDSDLCAVLDVADDHINCMYTITGTVGDALVQSGAATDGAVTTGMASQIICDVGTIDLSSSGDSGTGGTDCQTSVDLWYFPLDDGAKVVTA